MVAPVLPLLTDGAEALDALLARVAAAGATSPRSSRCTCGPARGSGSSAWLERDHPELVEPYARLYRRGAYVDPEYRRALAARVAPLLRRHGLTTAVAPLPGRVRTSASRQGAAAGPGAGARAGGAGPGPCAPAPGEERACYRRRGKGASNS